MRHLPQLAALFVALTGLASGLWLYRRGARRQTGAEEHSIRLIGCTIMVIFGWLLLASLASWLMFGPGRG